MRQCATLHCGTQFQRGLIFTSDIFPFRKSLVSGHAVTCHIWRMNEQENTI